MSHIFVDNEITARGWEDKVWVVNLVHDELVVESIEELAEEVAEVVVDCMVKAGKIFCHSIPMKVDPVITKIWTK